MENKVSVDNYAIETQLVHDKLLITTILFMVWDHNISYYITICSWSGIIIYHIISPSVHVYRDIGLSVDTMPT